MATHVHARSDLSGAERRRLGKRAQWLAAASVAYNGIEATIAIAASSSPDQLSSWDWASTRLLTCPRT